jgi:cellulose synthase/poly-beta-1,6-N-acetylglucosamine synthase-like glycosyltransferase
MLTSISCFLAGIAGLLSIPVAVLFVEVIAGLNSISAKGSRLSGARSPRRIAVIVPAHNESAGVISTIEDIKPQLDGEDQLIVVADNCSDDTASVAEAAGAEVIARKDPEKIGKGYALGFAIAHLSSHPPDFVVFIDADCRIQADMIGRLADECSRIKLPVQACFLMKAPKDSPIDHGFAEFAWIIRNWVRPLGLKYLNCPVQLMGTGMIFPWDVISAAPLASGNLVEDLKLGLDLAVLGKPAQFFPFVIGTSDFPVTAKGTDSQRQRWVQGHIGLIVATVPRLVFQSLKGRNLDLLVLTLDLLVPPLSLLGLLIVGVFVLACLTTLLGSPSAAIEIAAMNLMVFTIAVLFAWLKFGRDVLPARGFLKIGPLIFQKLRLYGQMLLGRGAAQWVRTDRGKPK